MALVLAGVAGLLLVANRPATPQKIAQEDRKKTEGERHSLVPPDQAEFKPGNGPDSVEDSGWKPLFDGKTLNGWRASRDADSWTVQDGAIVCKGPTSKFGYLFYEGDREPFRNFELMLDVTTTPGVNSGLFFHTRFSDADVPEYGVEVQIDNTGGSPTKTGSLYGLAMVTPSPAKDDEAFTIHLIVRNKRVVVRVNGKGVVNYTEPEGQQRASPSVDRRLNEGTFALQSFLIPGTARFKSIRVKRLPD